MDSPIRNTTAPLLAFGFVAFALAVLSIGDMFLPRPYDGVVLDARSPHRLIVQDVAPGSGADVAGIRPGDEIRGIHREVVRNASQATRVLNKLSIGDEVLYLVIGAGDRKTREVEVRLGRRQFGDGTYLFSCLLGFSFFLVGLFVLIRQPTLRVSQVFFLLCGFFLLFLVCRLRPPSYSGFDNLILSLGTVAFLLLPPALLHFYLLFPRPVWLDAAAGERWGGTVAGLWRRGWPAIYALPPLVFAASFALARLEGSDEVQLASGAPLANWWLLALYMLGSLFVLRANSRHLEDPRERRGMAMVLIGSLFGLVPFLISSVVFATRQASEAFFVLGIMPLVLVPITFAYAIVRFQLLDIRVILRRSLLYTVTTALVTGFYAAGIAAFNAFFRDSTLAASGYFPFVLALAIVVLFDPLRRRIQDLIDRFFFAERSRLQKAMVELGEALTVQCDLQIVVQELVEKLPRLLALDFAALYLRRGNKLVRLAGPENLPTELPVIEELEERLRQRSSSFTRLDRLGALPLRSAPVAHWVRSLTDAGVEAIGELASSRRQLGMVLLSAKQGRMQLEREDLELLQGLLRQASLALETSLLLEERTQRAELEREIEIAADIQARLLPSRLFFAEGWQVAALCRPARIVGGDFFSQLPSFADGNAAVVFGDVAGKSVSGALMMMAAHEALHTLAMTHREPGELFTLANRRVYALGQRNFVALGYFSACSDRQHLCYAVAGQPPPLIRWTDGQVFELPLPEHRLPIGALGDGEYCSLEVMVRPGEIVLGYSDGIVDARSPHDEPFTCTRLEAVVARSPADPDAIVRNVLHEIDAFTRGGLQYDDLTLVAVGRPAETVS